MQIVCVSQGSLVRGREFAEVLAEKLGYDLVTRDEILDMAVDEGIAVGTQPLRRPLERRRQLLHRAFSPRCRQAMPPVRSCQHTDL